MRKYNSPLKIAIVVDMWLTGFDVPSLATMYVLQTESLSALRGKIDISASVKEQSKISTDNRVFLQSVLNFFMRIRYRIHTVYRIFFLPISTQK